jgi:hypothetical protein
MVTLRQLTEKLEEDLNAQISADNLDGVLERTRFRFAVSLDTADYKRADKEQNTVTYYINALAKVISSETEGTTIGAYNASMQISLEFLIPQIDILDDNGNSAILEAAREVIGNALQLSTDYPLEADGINYSVIGQFRIAETGMRMMREQVGDSITLNVYGTYVFIAGGVPSTKIKLYLGETAEDLNPVYYSTLGISRTTTTEVDYASNEDDYSGAKATPLNTVLTMAVTSPLRLENYDAKAIIYAVTGGVVSLWAKLELPVGTDGQTVSRTFRVIYESVGISAQPGLAASYSYKLIEWREVAT